MTITADNRAAITAARIYRICQLAEWEISLPAIANRLNEIEVKSGWPSTRQNWRSWDVAEFLTRMQLRFRTRIPQLQRAADNARRMQEVSIVGHKSQFAANFMIDAVNDHVAGKIDRHAESE